MPIGELLLVWKAATTFRRLSARSFFCPLPLRMTSRRFSASASMSKFSMSFLIDSAPMAPSKYSP